jgi:hypothetical protein
MKKWYGALALLYLTACEAQGPETGSESSAYQFAIEPCMGNSQFGEITTHWVTIGPLSDGTKVKVRATSALNGDNVSRDVYTVTSQVINGQQTGCWDRMPTATVTIPETFVNDVYTVPGTSGYYKATYNQTRYGDIWGYGGVRDNADYNPVPWVRVEASVWNGSSYAPHAWLLYATDPYHWQQVF